MNYLLKAIGLLALGLTVVPPILLLAGAIAQPEMKHAMLCGCILWFGVAPSLLKGGAK
jgi:hypothetical protein